MELHINDILELYDKKVAELNRQVIILTVENKMLKEVQHGIDKQNSES
jgi:hypothetical protein